ncbi:MAG: IS1182 family transposase [Opitutaceae bacterium]
MMGQQTGQKELFSYQVDLDRRIRADHPLRAIRAQIDFSFVREEVAHCYGYNGQVSVDPEVILKLMFLLFLDNVKSERELMRTVPERLDYLWFLGFGLEDEIPDHSVFSKARARWGQPVFESLFVRTVQQCVAVGLVDGAKLHLDGSLITANASRDSVVRSGPELITALKRAYAVEERKLGGCIGDPSYQPVNASLCSTTDPDAPLVRQKHAAPDSRPRYKQHRAVDDRCGVVTAVVTTPGDVPEPAESVALIEQHETNTGQLAATVVADRQHGSAENYRQLQTRGLVTHIAPCLPDRAEAAGIFPRERFHYDETHDVYTCPAGQTLHPRRLNERRQAYEYVTRKGVCTRCALRSLCTRSASARTLQRHERQELIDQARTQGLSPQARRDRIRRRYLMEGSFAQAANCHGFKRARWRRLWRQQIQDWLIAACQNVKLLLRACHPGPRPAQGHLLATPGTQLLGCSTFLHDLLRPLHSLVPASLCFP